MHAVGTHCWVKGEKAYNFSQHGNLLQIQKVRHSGPRSMKLHLEQPSSQNQVTGYGAGYISINAVRHATHLLVTPQQVEVWDVAEFAALNRNHFAHIAGFDPELVIFGTGRVQRFPRPELLQPLVEAGIGLEVMDSGAACRTYNILMAENRRVLAAILLA